MVNKEDHCGNESSVEREDGRVADASNPNTRRIEQLEEENEELRNHIEDLRAAVDIQDGQGPGEGAPEDREMGESDESEVEVTPIDDEGEGSDMEVESGAYSRRGVLGSLAALGVVGIGATGTASAASGDHLGESWRDTLSGECLQLINDGEGVGLNAIVTPNSGTTIGLRGKVNSADGRGVYGLAGSGSGYTKGVKGEASSPNGRGVEGVNTASSGPAYGVFGRTHASDATALYGHASSGSGQTRGIFGRVDSPDGTAIRARATATGTGDSKGIYVTNKADDSVGLESEVTGSGSTYGVKGTVSSSSGYGLYTPDDAKIGQKLEIDGDIQCTGQKNFVQAVDTPSGPKRVTYTAVEAGKAHTEVTDTAELEDGRAEIDLPEHFEMVTSDEEDLTVQITPYASERVHPQVVDRSTEHLVVEDFGDGPGDYTISYTVKGIREGFEDVDIVRDQ